MKPYIGVIIFIRPSSLAFYSSSNPVPIESGSEKQISRYFILYIFLLSSPTMSVPVLKGPYGHFLLGQSA